jgi:hypothetical protein
MVNKKSSLPERENIRAQNAAESMWNGKNMTVRIILPLMRPKENGLRLPVLPSVYVNLSKNSCPRRHVIPTLDKPYI